MSIVHDVSPTSATKAPAMPPGSAVTEWLAAAAFESEAHEFQRNGAALYLRESFPELLAYATDIWKNETDALEWLLHPHSELEDNSPVALLQHPEGEQRVINLLAALEHGFPV